MENILLSMSALLFGLLGLITVFTDQENIILGLILAGLGVIMAHL